MTISIMDQYIQLVKKQINAYMRITFGNKFNKMYSDSFTEKYINVRYYNFYEEDINTNTRRKILSQLKETEDHIVIGHIEDRELIAQMRIFFYYVLYFDHVVYYKDLEKIVEKIEKIRKKNLNSKSENFVEKLYNKMEEFEKQKENLINKLQTEDFYLKITKYPEKLNIFRVNLKYNFELPKVYSEFAINKAFNTGITNEDKLTVEYYLIVQQVIKDLMKQNFKRQYIIEFTPTLLTKTRKLKSLLNIVNNLAIQDKISLKIKYEDFIGNKEKVYNLMREGYRITVVIDNSFEVNEDKVESLKAFKYVILSKQSKHYEKFTKYKDRLQNIIEI